MNKTSSGQQQKKFIGSRLFDWQADVHNGLLKNGRGSHYIHCVKSKRQVGKSHLILGELLFFAINFAKTVNGCISPTMNQVRKIYKEILKVTENSGVIKKKNDSLLEIEFINGSTILFKSAEQRDNLRGYTYSGILCIDEAAYISDEIYGIIKPSTDVHRCPILMVSTPKFRVGFFYQTYQQGLDGARGIKSYDFCNYDTSALLTPEALELYKQMLPSNQFKTEYLGEFLDADGCVFTHFKECCKPIVGDYKSIYVGIDWATGTGNDYTVLTGINERGEQIFLTYFNNKTTTEQIDYITAYLSKYMPSIKVMMCEDNSIGLPMINNLREKLSASDGKKIQQFTTTNKEKARVINQLQVAFEQQKIRLINDDKQLAQLGMYEAKYNHQTGNVTYNAPAGANDDICIALCLAWEAKQHNNSGQYSFIFL